MKRAVKIILLNPKKEILLQLRDDKPDIPSPGCWDFIGGGVEEGEEPVEAIKREIREEIEIFIDDVEMMRKIRMDGWVCFVFKGKIEVPVEKIRLNEGQKLGYFKFDELGKIKFPWFEFVCENKERIFS